MGDPPTDGDGCGGQIAHPTLAAVHKDGNLLSQACRGYKIDVGRSQLFLK